MSAGLASSSSAATWRAFSTTCSVAVQTAEPPSCREREPKVPCALGDAVGVAGDDLDLLHRDAGELVGEHGPGRVVALAVSRRTGVDGDRAVAVQHHLGELALAGGAGGDLDVGRHADAELDGVAGGATGGLLGPQGGVVGGLEGEVERLGVVAAVVDRAGGGGEREGVLGDEVLAPHLDGIHADLGGEQVEGALDGGGGLGTTGAAVGLDRGGVGHHRLDVALDLRDVVGAGRHRAGHERQERPHARVGAGILQHGEAVGLDLAVAAAADLDPEHLAAAVGHREHALAAGLGPAHRAVETTGDPGQQGLVGLEVDLGAETAADGRGHHADLLGLEAVEAGELALGAVRGLGGDEGDETALVPGHGDAPGLERAHGEALVRDGAVDDDLAALEQLVAGVAERHLEGDVGAVLGEEEDLALLGLDRVDDDVEGLVVDDDQLRRVLGGGLGLGHDHSDDVADEAHGVGGDPGPGQAVGDHPGDGDAVGPEVVGGGRVGAGVHGDDAGHLGGLGDVDLGERGVGHGRAHEEHVERALEQRVVEVGGVLVRPGQEGGILTSLDPGPHHAHLCHSPRRSLPRASPEGRRRLPDG